MPLSLHTVVETRRFFADARRVLTETEKLELIDFVALHPTAGDLMQGTGGARKLRWGAKGQGKRGGARVITFYGGPQMPAFLLTAFGKGERSNLTKAERNELRTTLAHLVAEYRRGAS